MNKDKKILKVIVELFRVIVGVTFAFSGFVKAVDPLGFTYKIQDYLISFDLVSLFPFALPVAIIMVVAEMLIGIFLLLGIYRRTSTIAVTIFMAFFLPLTLWIAIYNPVEDCGCFGDAWVISNWQTFYKNIVLFIGSLVLLFNYKVLKPVYSIKFAWIAATIVIVFGFSFAIYNTVKLPVFDFRPFKIGANIAEQMEVDPENEDTVENIFIYSKDGVEKEFTEDNYPWDDSTWVYVDMTTRVISKGEAPKIEDFHIGLFDFENEIQEDITDKVLNNPDYTFLMVSYFVDKMNMKHYHKFVKAQRFANDNNIDFYLLTSSLEQSIIHWKEVRGDDFEIAEADERVLKTMIRSNPGLILLHNGTVINKWDDSEIPIFQKAPLETFNKVDKQNINFWYKLVVIFLLLLIPLGLLKTVDLRYNDN